MTPPKEVIAEIDRIVQDYDTETLPLGVRSAARATSGFAVIVGAWTRFMTLVTTLDAAIEQPLAPASARALRQADKLVAEDVFRLQHWLTHVGCALDREARSSQSS